MISKSKAIKIPSLDADTVLGLVRFCGNRQRNMGTLTRLVKNCLLIIAEQNNQPTPSEELEHHYQTLAQILLETRTNQPEQGE